MQKKYIKYIVLIAVLVIYTLFLLIFKSNKELVNDNTYIVIGDNTRWQYVDEKWEDLDVSSRKFGETEFTVYKNSKIQGNYFLQYYSDTWYFFDKNNKSQELETGNLFAYSSDLNLKMIEFEKNDMTMEEINKVLKQYDIKISKLTEVSYASKIVIDVDNDNIDENIYAISSIMAEDQGSTNFSFVLYENNGKISPLIEKKKRAQYIYDIYNIIDFNSDGNLEIILEHQKPMNPSYNCHSMYELRSRKYILAKSC